MRVGLIALNLNPHFNNPDHPNPKKLSTFPHSYPQFCELSTFENHGWRYNTFFHRLENSILLLFYL